MTYDQSRLASYRRSLQRANNRKVIFQAQGDTQGAKDELLLMAALHLAVQEAEKSEASRRQLEVRATA